MTFQFGAPNPCRPEEDAGIPIMAAGLDHLLRPFKGRLFDETVDRVQMIAPLSRRDVTEPRRRMIRFDAEGDNASVSAASLAMPIAVWKAARSPI